MTNINGKTLGVIGGLGPLASAAFVNAYYRLAAVVEREQEWSKLILISDPSFPARSPENLASRTDELVAGLLSSTNALLNVGCDRLVMCCFTLHSLLQYLEPEFTRKFVHLPDLALRAVGESNNNFVLLCADGSRAAQVFQKSPHWGGVEPSIQILPEGDQRLVQKTINGLKIGLRPDQAWEAILSIADKHRVRGMIFGCTEFHLVSEWLQRSGINSPIEIIDPLVIVARRGINTNAT